jgi:hypothetical protein
LRHCFGVNAPFSSSREVEEEGRGRKVFVSLNLAETGKQQAHVYLQVRNKL